MSDFNLLSKEELIDKIHEYQTLLNAMKAEMDQEQLPTFPWSSNLGKWFLHVHSNQVVCDERRLRALGYTRGELPESMSYDFFADRLHPDDYERVMESIRDHLHERTPAYEASYRIQARDGRWLWFYDHALITQRDPSSRPDLLAGITFDITAQRKLEEELAQKNKQLLEFNLFDPLTRQFNRRALFNSLDFEMRKARRMGQPLCLILFDIDQFKRINDVHGHAAGDKVLARVAGQMRKNIRNSDVIGRYSGEEFLVLLSECPLEGGIKVANKIRQNIQDEGFESGLKVTISGGVVEYQNQSIDQLIDEADQRLSAAKEAGRNQIMPAAAAS